MSLLQRLTRTVRPTSFNPATPLRSRNPTFFSPHSIHHIKLGLRFHSSSSYERIFSQNRALLYGIIGLNTGIFVYSAFLQARAKQGFQEPAVRFIRNMTLNLDEVQAGKWWIMVTSVFMHKGIMHLAMNMLSTYYLGNMVASIPGITPMRLLYIILGSGITGSIGYLYVRYRKTNEMKNQWGLRQPDTRRGLGFSGAVTGLGVVAAFVYPKAKIYIWGIVPAPLWALMLGFVVYDGYYLNDNNSKVAHAGHLGGAAFGAFYFLTRLRRVPFLR